MWVGGSGDWTSGVLVEIGHLNMRVIKIKWLLGIYYLAVHFQFFLSVTLTYTQVAMYGDIGGSSLDAIRRMMPHPLSPNLAVLFNLHGCNHYGCNSAMMSYMVSLPIKLPCVAFLVTYNVFIWQHFLCMRRRHSIQHIRQWKWDTANLNWCHSRRFYNAMISNSWLLVISFRGTQEKRHDTRDQPPGCRKGDLQVVHWSSW